MMNKVNGEANGLIDKSRPTDPCHVFLVVEGGVASKSNRPLLLRAGNR